MLNFRPLFCLFLLVLICTLLPGCGGGGTGGTSPDKGRVSGYISTNGGTLQSNVGKTAGTRVVFPAGAVSSQTVFSVQPGDDLGVGSYLNVGPAIELLPEGYTFNVPVQVSIPYVASLIPAGLTPNDLVVLKVAGGISSVLIPDSVDIGNSLLTVSVTSFSVFQAAAQFGPSASNSSVVVSKTSILANGIDSIQIDVIVRDQIGDPVPDATVQILVSGTGNSVNAPPVTDSSGVTAGSFVSTVPGAKTVQVQVHSHGVFFDLIDSFTVDARTGDPDASTSTVTASPTQIVADGSDQSTISINVLDPSSLPVEGVSVTLSSSVSSDVFTQPGATDQNGESTASIVVTEAGNRTITAEVAVGTAMVTLDQKPVVFAIAGAVDPDSSTVDLSVSSIRANGVDETTVSIQVLDAQSNPFVGMAVDISVSGTGNTVSAVPLTDVNGMTSATITTTVAEQKVVSVTVDPLGASVVLSDQPVFQVFGPVHVGAGFSSVSVSPNHFVADGQDESVITVTLRDANGAPVPNVEVTLDVGGTNNVISTPTLSDANGQSVATLTSTVSESKSIRATVIEEGVHSQLEDGTTAFAEPGPPNAAQSEVSASPASILANGVDACSVQIRLRDAFGNTVPSTAVQLTVSGTGNQLTAPNSTDSMGRTTGSFTTTSPEQKEISVTADPFGLAIPLDSVPVVHAYSALPDGQQSTIAATPTSGIPADGSSSATVTVTVRDTSGVPVEGAQVSLSSTSQGLVIGQPAVATGSDGKANGTIASSQSGSVEVRASVSFGGSTVDLDDTVTIQFSPLVSSDHLEFGYAPPLNAYVAQPWEFFTVKSIDAQGDLISGDNGQISLSLKVGSGNLSGTLTVDMVNGIAVFDDVSFDTSGSIQLTCTRVGSSDAVDSESIEILQPLGADLPMTRVALTHSGGQADLGCELVSIGTYGNWVLVRSESTNLVLGDTNSAWDLFLVEVSTAEIRRVSVSSSGGQLPSSTEYGHVSSGGRFVVFESVSPAVAGDVNGVEDVFLLDCRNDILLRVSESSGGVGGNGRSARPRISPNGRWITFFTEASNLVAADLETNGDVLLYDVATGEMELLSVDENGTNFLESSSAGWFATYDGNLVGFWSAADGVVSGDTNGWGDGFLRDRQADTVEIYTLRHDGSISPSHLGATGFAMSPDARFVLFGSHGNTFVLGDTNSSHDLFLRDRVGGTTDRVNLSSTGNQLDAHTYNGDISADGRYVVFSNTASNVVVGDTDSNDDVYIRDLNNGITQRVSLNADSSSPGVDSWEPRITSDGRHIFFTSAAHLLIAGDSNEQEDIFMISNPLAD